ncbi:MAG: twin-arginine translocation signal domain-containing protein, partial [Alphaproteobacteria bacterium]|nr:twin-arginine translocation signal domain-containing protein [Alphaproteobacteria bacterium]
MLSRREFMQMAAVTA